MSDMPWFSVWIIACTPQFWPRDDGNRADTDIDCKVVVRLGVIAQREQFFALITRHPHGDAQSGRDVCLRNWHDYSSNSVDLLPYGKMWKAISKSASPCFPVMLPARHHQLQGRDW